MSFTPKILWDPHGILPPLSFFLLPPSLSPLSFPPSAFLFTLARAAAVVAVGTTVGNGGAVATVGRRRRSSDERASSPTGATVGTRLSPRESSVSSDPCRLSRPIERVSIIRAPCPSPSRRPAAVFAVGTLSLPREHRRRQPPRSSLRQPPPPSCLLPPPPPPPSSPPVYSPSVACERRCCQRGPPRAFGSPRPSPALHLGYWEDGRRELDRWRERGGEE